MGCFGSKHIVNEDELEYDEEGGFVKLKDFWDLYDFDATIAKGGSCDVLRVKHQQTKEIYAAKELHHYKHRVERLFDREVKILRMLEQHPNIIEYQQSYKVASGHFFIVTGYLSGGELFDRILAKAELQEFNEVYCAHVTQQMLSALDALHRHDIVHRDLKPENFVFETTAEDSNIRMIDFGNAIEIEDSTKRYKEVCGTPYYMPPEAVKNKSRTLEELKRGDMFAMGVIVYIMMSGIPPFPGNTDEEIFYNIKEGDYTWPRGHEWSKPLKRFIEKCLYREPLKRISVDDALFDTWVTGAGASKELVDLQVLGSLRKFVKASHLQKAIVNLMVKNVDASDKNNLERMFKRLDKDGNGQVTEEEMVAALIDDGMYGPQATKEAHRILQDTDIDGNGHIDFQEFVEARARNKLSTDLQVLQAVFNILDTNGDDFVDKSELKTIFGEDGNHNLGDPEIVQMIEEVDFNKDGKISYEEFMGALSQSVGTKRMADVIRRSVDARSRAESRQNRTYKVEVDSA